MSEKPEKKQLGIFGHVVVDHIYIVEKLPQSNTTVPIEKSQMFFGGTGGNIAHIAAKLGVKTALASFVGSDFPKQYYQNLKNANVCLKDLKILPHKNTPCCWIFTDKKGNYIAVIDQGAMKQAYKYPVLKFTIDNSKIVHIGTGIPQYYLKVAKYAKKKNKKIAFDPSQELRYVYDKASFRQIFYLSDYFFANTYESKLALKYLGLKNIDELLNYVSTIIITQKSKGSIIYTPTERLKIPAVKPKKMLDSTGAGDAYRAGFYAGIVKNYDLYVCGLLGAATSSFILEKPGTQTNIPTFEEIIERLNKQKLY